MILIGSDLTNESALSAKWSANQMKYLDWLSVNLYVYYFPSVHVHLINLANFNTTEGDLGDFKCYNMKVFTKFTISSLWRTKPSTVKTQAD